LIICTTIPSDTQGKLPPEMYYSHMLTACVSLLLVLLLLLLLL
jgi:hypothetical protein